MRMIFIDLLMIGGIYGYKLYKDVSARRSLVDQWEPYEHWEVTKAIYPVK